MQVTKIKNKDQQRTVNSCQYHSLIGEKKMNSEHSVFKMISTCVYACVCVNLFTFVIIVLFKLDCCYP